MSKRHPALVKRDAAYASAVRHPRLVGDDGDLYVSPMPTFTELIGLRPLTLEEQVARFTRSDLVDFNLVPDQHFLSEDDFHDYLDDLPDEGWSDYELAGFDNIVRQHELGRGYVHIPPAEGSEEAADAAGTPLPAGGAERPQKAGGAPPAGSDDQSE